MPGSTAEPPSAGPGGAASFTYLAGTSYCGSTLLSFLFNAHPQVVTIGEAGPAPRFADRSFPCSCGLPVRECPFLVALAAAGGFGPELDRGADWGLRHRLVAPAWGQRLVDTPVPWSAFERARAGLLHRLPRVERRRAATNDRMARVVDEARALTGAPVFLDATKQAGRILHLADSQPTMRILHLVREPGAFVESSRRRGSDSALRAALVWVRVNRTVEAIAAGRGLPYQRVRYEDLVGDPVATYRDLCRFMGVDATDPPDDYLATGHHIIGNSMRLAGRGRIAPATGGDGPASSLPPLAALVVRRLARRYGYRGRETFVV